MSLSAELMAEVSVATGRIRAATKNYPAAILHPSLGCPLLVEDTEKVSLFIVAEEELREAFLQGNGGIVAPGAPGGDNVRLIVNHHLKIHRWEEAGENQKNLTMIDRTLFGKDHRERIDCHYLGKLGEELRDRDGRHFANLRPTTVRHFAQANLTEVFQIEIREWPFQAQTLYDAFWATRNEEAQSFDLHRDFLDARDRMVRRFVGRTWRGRQRQAETDPSTGAPLCAFAVDAERGVTFERDPNVPLQSRHPIYVPPTGKRQLNIGHLSDIHISSRQHAYKNKQATVIPGAEAQSSEPIGELANNNAENFFDLLQQFSDDPDVDILVITGDLYDHIHNFDPLSRDTSTTGRLWEAMYVNSIKAIRERAEEYPYGIDALAVYSLLVHHYTHRKSKKPVLLISGNHEAYEYPYGISPRKKLIGKVNEGIPLDHNLTIYEAILLYGPGYDKVLRDFNFAEENFDWFSTVFTPLADFVVSYKDQNLIGLEWGSDESFVRSTMRGGGSLPRATKSLTPRQGALIEAALAEGRDTVLCSHFTLVNYSLKKSLSEQGLFDVSSAMFADYDHGSSHGDRSALYERFLNHPRLKLSLAGHSHRVGLYACDQSVQSAPIPYYHGSAAEYLQAASRIHTRAYHPEDPANKNVTWNNRTQVFVTASAGPIPKQNIQGEMSGQGMECPSAGKIFFSGGEPRVSLVKSRKKAAKPRFAVACDYIDIMEGGFWEYFRAVGNGGEFELKIHWEKIAPNFPQQKMGDFIESVTLWLVGDMGSKKETAKQKLSGETLIISFSPNLKKKLKPNKMSTSPAIFLSLKFNTDAVKQLHGFKDYDYDSPWIIQVGIYDAWGRDVLPAKQDKGRFGKIIDKSGVAKASMNPATWQIRRHKKFGEVPSFRFRRDRYRAEYDTDLPLEI